MKKIFLLLFLLLPLSIFSQDAGQKQETKSDQFVMSPQARYAENFNVKHIYFNKRIDERGRGEVLEVELIFENLTDDPMDFYIFVITSCELPPKKLTSFDRPVKQKDKLRNFVPYPYEMENFEYPLTDQRGNTVTDEKGNEVMTYLKNPRDPKKGINTLTGEPYTLDNKELVVRTYHLSPYRVNYTFFNHVTVIVYDADAEPIYRQVWHLRGLRR